MRTVVVGRLPMELEDLIERRRALDRADRSGILDVSVAEVSAKITWPT